MGFDSDGELAEALDRLEENRSLREDFGGRGRRSDRGEGVRGPDFFIVGEAKSGTSALYRGLSLHPEIFMCRPKEPEYFCRDFHDESDRLHGRRRFFPIREEGEYLRLFRRAGSARRLGETSTSYLFSRTSAEAIKAFNSNARIIVMLRDPLQFLQSFHAQLVFNLFEEIVDLRAAMAAEGERRRGEKIPRRARFPSELFYSERVRQAAHLGRYLDLFPASQVMILLHEEFRADNAGTFRRTFDFLDVENTFLPPPRVFNARKRPRFRRLKYFLESPGVTAAVKGLLPEVSHQGAKRLVSRFFSKPGRREVLDEEFRALLEAKLAPEVERTGRLLEVDLPRKWGYGPRGSR